MTAVRDEAVDAVRAMAPTDDEKAALSVLSALADDLKTLARPEVELAKAGMTSEVSKVGKGAAMFAGAAFAALMFVIFLPTAAWWGLANIVDQSWAALIVAGVWLLLAAVSLSWAARSSSRSV